jgi:transposase
MRVLRMAREPAQGGKADRTGVFTSGIVSTQQGRRIALYFTGRQHAGENLRDVLQHRAADLAPPLQMCDALSRNTPKLSDGAEILLANCLAHYPESGIIRSERPKGSYGAVSRLRKAG